MGLLQLAALLVSLLVAVDANIRSEEEPFLPSGKHGLLFGEINLAIASVKILFFFEMLAANCYRRAAV